MSYNNKYATKFDNIMSKTIQQWDKYETNFYNNTIVPICKADPLLQGLLLKGKANFPHNLWLVWVYQYVYPDLPTIEALDAVWQIDDYVFTVEGNTHPVVKGKRFEDLLAKRAETNDILQHLAQALPGKLQHAGKANKREDFLLTDEFSIDIKYSGIQNDDRFKNIIKPWGQNFYTATNKIQEGILRSMYREGDSQGLFRPNAESQNKNYGILKYNATTGFSEVGLDDYIQANIDTKYFPSTRKNILYLYR